MDLVDIIAEKRFLGQEFLTWLWWKSEERGGSVSVDGRDISVVFEKHMLLEVGEGEQTEKIVCTGLQAELREARTGLQMGKKLEQARIVIGQGQHEYACTLTGSLLEFRNVKLPTSGDSEFASMENPEEQEGAILERVFLIEELTRIVDGLLKTFLELRTSASWPEELARIRRWVGSAAAS